MTAPTGTLIADFYQARKLQARIIFTIFAVTALIATLLIVEVIVSTPTEGFVPFVLLIIPALLVIPLFTTVAHAFTPARKLQIYSDGFTLRELKSDAPLEQALWTEVNDITIF